MSDDQENAGVRESIATHQFVPNVHAPVSCRVCGQERRFHAAAASEESIAAVPTALSDADIDQIIEGIEHFCIGPQNTPELQAIWQPYIDKLEALKLRGAAEPLPAPRHDLTCDNCGHLMLERGVVAPSPDVCTGPFSDAFDCPIHDPRKPVAPAPPPQEDEYIKGLAREFMNDQQGLEDKIEGYLYRSLHARTAPPPQAPLDPEAITTYTPLMWMTLNEDEKYEEYIRVREALMARAVPASQDRPELCDCERCQQARKARAVPAEKQEQP